LALGLNTLEVDPQRVYSVVCWEWIMVSLITSFMK
jgi:hypothetical protein